eukprot:gene9475-biopygen11351
MAALDPRRSTRGAGRGQGLLVFVRNRLAAYCKSVKATPYYLWLELALPRAQLVYLCAVYLPPVASVVWSGEQGWQDVFEQLTADIMQYKVSGHVCVLGDFNAHTGRLDDVGALAQAVLGELAVVHTDVGQLHVPPRCNQDSARPDQFGRALVQLCVSTGCFLLNGRASGDQGGACTYASRGQPCSVIDYGLVSPRLWQSVTSFKVLPLCPAVSDHCPLLCQLTVPQRCLGVTDAGVTVVNSVRYDPDRRDAYVAALLRPSAITHRNHISEQLQSGALSVTAASDAFCAHIRSVAVQVFGATSGHPRPLRSGILPKPWFRHCKQHWEALRQAVMSGNTHAARQARAEFNKAKRKYKRYYDKCWQARFLEDMCHNPRRFWTAYQGPKLTTVLHSMHQLECHWRALFGTTGQQSLPECANSVHELLTRLSSVCPNPPTQAAVQLNDPISVMEVQTAICNLHNGRMAGPDGIRGELFKTAYVDVELLDGRRRRDYILLPVLHQLLSAAFEVKEVPAVWCTAYVSAVFKKAGVQLGPTLLQLLLYADDLALVASSPAALRQLLDSLAGFCQQYAMEVNVRKTEVVEFRRPRTRPTDWQWTFAGHVLPVSQQFRYLGVVFHATKGMTAAVDVLRDAALRAMWGMLSRAKALGIHCLAVLCRLFHTLVVPIMTYCSEVWGPLLLSRGGALGSVHTNVLQQVQLLFLRRLGGLRKSTPAALLFREFGARPLSRDWLRAMVQLWNRVTTLPADHVMRRTMVDNWSLHLSAHPKVVLWSDGFASALAALGFPPTSFMAMSATGCWVMSHLDMDQVLAAFDEWCDGAWGHLPRDPRGSSSEHILYATYARWFTRPAAVDQVALLHSPADVPRYVTFSGRINSAHLRSLMRFRLSAHALHVVTGRWHRTPRQERLCEYCAQCKIEDEYHLLFECDAYNPVRQWFAPLFVCCGGLDDAGRVNRGVLDPCDVRVFMSQHPRRVAAFIHECFAWRAQEVRLPPYVPAAYMLDTFSSSVSELMVVDDDDVEIHS